MKIGIVGLGLIGGSMAKAIAKYTSHTVYGADTNDEILEMALEQGVLAGQMNDTIAAELDLLYLALYPADAIETLKTLAPKMRAGALVVDLCGVKQAVYSSLDSICRETGLHYIGGHPMAGRELSGYAAATAELFQGASMILTPPQDARAEDMETLSTLSRSIGFARIQLSTPQEHDRIIAYTSQLAHVVSCAYVQSPTSDEYMGFSAGSFRDMTRVAKLNEYMWTQLFLDNREDLIREIEGLSRRLDNYARVLKEGDSRELCLLLKNAREKKEALEERG